VQVFGTNKLEGKKMDLQNIQDQLNTEFFKFIGCLEEDIPQEISTIKNMSSQHVYRQL